MTNCPNCGAPFRHGVCDYCGTEMYGTSSNELAIDVLRCDIIYDTEKAKLFTMYNGSLIEIGTL